MKREWLIIIAIALFLGVDSAMYGFTIKPGVSGTLQPIMNPALDAVKQVWTSYGLDTPVITSIEDGQHMDGSKHYLGLAFDVRLNDISVGIHDMLREDIQTILGTTFDVVHEYHGTPSDHMHIELH